jgi:hypothetical protein
LIACIHKKWVQNKISAWLIGGEREIDLNSLCTRRVRVEEVDRKTLADLREVFLNSSRNELP